MKIVRAVLVVFMLLTTAYSLLPTATQAACCRCYKSSDTAPNSFCVNDAAVTSCSGAAAQIAGLSGLEATLTADITCTTSPLSDTACAAISSGGSSAQCRVIAHLNASEIRSALPATSAPASAGETLPRPFSPINVDLGVPIGNVTSLSGITSEGNAISIPFLGTYVNAVYRYMAGIVIVTAIVMVVYGGFLYLTGSTSNNVGRGKEIIRDALVGLVLVLAAYGILNTINPATVNYPNLRLQMVTEESLLSTTESATEDDQGESDSETVNPIINSGIAFTPPATNPYSSCPVSLENPISTSPYLPRDARDTEFIDEFRRAMSASGGRSAVVQAAQAAQMCGLHMGSCGHTADTIYELAHIASHGISRFAVGSDNIRFLIDVNQNCSQNHPGERPCKINARHQAYERFSTQISGWPNDWARTLQPGDYIRVYTGHPDGAGQHAAIFMGWAGRGRARLFQGQWAHNVNEATYCITTDCPNMYPITAIWSPE